jgi:hypothetical protein
MRIPDCGPFGETLREAKVRAMVAAFLVNRPFGGWVESVFTSRTHRFPDLRDFAELLGRFAELRDIGVSPTKPDVAVRGESSSDNDGNTYGAIQGLV